MFWIGLWLDYFWNSFLAIDPSELWWQMDFLINSEQSNMYQHRKFNRTLGNFDLGCITLQHTVSRKADKPYTLYENGFIPNYILANFWQYTALLYDTRTP